MKNIIIKTMFALLLIIEFYPIESNSQTVNEIKACCIHNSDEEPVYGYSEELEFQQAEDRNIEYSTSENANEDIYDEVDTFENVNEDVDEDEISGNADEDDISDEQSEDANIENNQSGFEGSFQWEYYSKSEKNSFIQLLSLTLLKY